MVILKLSRWSGAAYPGPDTPGVAGQVRCLINPAGIVLEREAKDVKLISPRWD
jgi:hypothetical protein